MERDPNLPYHLRPEVAPTYRMLFTDDPSQKTTPSGPGQNLLAPPKLRSRPIERTTSVLDVRTDVEASSQQRKDLASRGRKKTIGRSGKNDTLRDPIPVKAIPQLPLDSELVQKPADNSSSRNSSGRGSSGPNSSNRVTFSHAVLVKEDASTSNDKPILVSKLPFRSDKGRSLNGKFGLKPRAAKNRDSGDQEGSDLSRESSPVIPRAAARIINAQDNACNDDLQKADPLDVAKEKFRLATEAAAVADFKKPKEDIGKLTAAINHMERARDLYLDLASTVSGTLSALGYKSHAAKCMLAASSYSSHIAMCELAIEIDQGLAFTKAQRHNDRASAFSLQADNLLNECTRELNILLRRKTNVGNTAN